MLATPGPPRRCGMLRAEACECTTFAVMLACCSIDAHHAQHACAPFQKNIPLPVASLLGASHNAHLDGAPMLRCLYSLCADSRVLTPTLNLRSGTIASGMRGA